MKKETKLLNVRLLRQSKIIADIDTEMILEIQNTCPENVSSILIKQWKKETTNDERKAREKFTLKESWFKENWSFEHPSVRDTDTNKKKK